MNNAFQGARILLLGGTGPVARLIHRQLVECGPAVLDMPSHGVMELPKDVRHLSTNYDILINFAALSRPGPTNREAQEALNTNMVAVQRLLEHFRGTTTKIVSASSVKTTAVDSMYGWSKLAAEAVLATAEGVHAVSVRLGNVVETAPSIDGILRSIQASSALRGFVAASSEFYQMSNTVLETIEIACHCRQGSLVTPLLECIPLTFIAGYLAGLLERPHRQGLRDWAPDYHAGQTPPSLIPEWWLPYTTLEHVMLPTGCSRDYLITNFKTRCGDAVEIDATRSAIEAGQKPRFGEFAEALAQVLSDTRALRPTRTAPARNKDAAPVASS